MKDAKIAKLEKGAEQINRKVVSMKEQIRQLSSDLGEEKHKSRLAMAKLLSDAESMIADAYDARDEMDAKLSTAQIVAEEARQKISVEVQKERQFMSSKINTCEFDVSLVLLCYYYNSRVHKLDAVLLFKSRWMKPIELG